MTIHGTTGCDTSFKNDSTPFVDIDGVSPVEPTEPQLHSTNADIYKGSAQAPKHHWHLWKNIETLVYKDENLMYNI